MKKIGQFWVNNRFFLNKTVIHLISTFATVSVINRLSGKNTSSSFVFQALWLRARFSRNSLYKATIVANTN